MVYPSEKSPIKDSAVIDRLVNEVGEAIFAELVAVFIEQTDTLFGFFEASLETTDTCEAIRLAHSIKSGARSYGAVRLADFAAAMEANLRDNNREFAKDNLTSFHHLLNSTIKEYSRQV